MELLENRARLTVLALVVTVAGVLVGCSNTPTETSDPASRAATGAGSQPPGTAAGTSTSTTKVTAADAVRSVDFANFTFAANTCGDSNRTQPYVLTDGAASVPGGASVTIDTTATAYGDVTGDGVDEAVVLVSCNSGGSATDVVPVVFTVDDAGDAAWLAILSAEGRDDRAVTAVSIREAQIVTDEAVFAPDDPRCCPSVTGTTLWQWQDGAFVVFNSTETGGSTATTAPVTAPPPGETDPTLITVNSVGAIRLGMSKEDLFTATGITVTPTTPACGLSPYDAVGEPEGLDLMLDEAGAVRAITVSTNTYLTAANASVGSFVFDLQSVYPDLAHFDFGGSGGEGAGQWAVFAPDRSSGIFFNVYDDQVRTITVTFGSSGFTDLC